MTPPPTFSCFSFLIAPLRGGGGVSQKVIFDDQGGGGVNQKAIVDDKGGGGGGPEPP